MRTTIDLPLRWLVTLTLEPKGRVRCAAVRADGFILSPDAVFECKAYHEAPPQADPALADAAPNITIRMDAESTVRILAKETMLKFALFMARGRTAGLKTHA